MTRPAPRRLADAYSQYHNLSYYCAEAADFTAAGMSGFWMAYFAYRSAPLGPAPAEVVTATFYGFAPRMVARAVPAVWDVMSPQGALDLRDDIVDRALRRTLGDLVTGAEVAEAAELARHAIEGIEVAGRPLYAAHVSLPWPEAPHQVLFHACTLLREQRGDSHSIALAADQLDGVACHVMMAATGHGNRASILPIRGWTGEEWDAAAATLVERGWLDEEGAATDAGRAARAAVELRTDELSAGPARRLGDDGVDRFVELMAPMRSLLAERGGVPASWPPPHLLR